MVRGIWPLVSIRAIGAWILGLVCVSAAAAAPVRIGLSLGLTGVYAAPAQMQQRAYAQWADELNARGGLLGRQIELTVEDDTSQPDTAARIYRRLIEERQVDLVLSPYSSAITAAVAPITEQHQLPLLAAGASADTLWQRGYRYLFGMWVPATQYTHGMLRLAASSGLRRVAILNADDAFSKAIRAGTERWSRYVPLELVSKRGFPKGAKDLEDHIAATMQAKPDLVMVAGHFDDAANVRRALDSWQSLNGAERLPAFYATVGPALSSWHNVMDTLAGGAYSTSVWEPSVSFPDAAGFARRFEARYGVEPSYHAATAFAAGQLVALAVQRANSLDSKLLRDVLADLDTNTVIGRYGVDRTGMQVKSVPLIVQWRNGRKVIVWPSAQRLESRQ